MGIIFYITTWTRGTDHYGGGRVEMGIWRTWWGNKIKRGKIIRKSWHKLFMCKKYCINIKLDLFVSDLMSFRACVLSVKSETWEPVENVYCTRICENWRQYLPYVIFPIMLRSPVSSHFLLYFILYTAKDMSRMTHPKLYFCGTTSTGDIFNSGESSFYK